MKKLFYTLLAILLFQYAYAQKREKNFIEEKVDLVEQEVNRINNEICFRTQIDYRHYFTSDTIHVDEWLGILYFNNDHQIVKSKLLFSYPEESGFYCRYFDKNGVAIHALYSTCSGMSNSFFVSRYLNKDKSLLYIDFLRLDEDAGGIVVEQIRRSGYYNLPASFPQESGRVYDQVMELKDLMSDFKRVHFEVDSLYMPSKVTPVKFILPRKGDQTYITHNSVPLHKDTSMIYAPVIELNVGANVQVLDVDENWCKIKYMKWEGMEAVETIAYVEQKFLAHVEIKQ